MSIPVKISGSRAAAVLGLSPWQSQVEVWLKIQEELNPGFCLENNYDLPVFEGNSSTRWGTAFESAIIELTEQKLNSNVTDRERFYEKDYLSCHIDGIIEDSLLENKTTSMFSFSNDWGEPGTDKIPIEYQLQIQHNLYLSGLKNAVLSVLVFPKRPEEWEEMGIIPKKQEIENTWFFCDKEDKIIDEPMSWAHSLNQMGYFHQYPIPANPDLQSLMLEKYKTFWTENVIGRTPPAPSDMSDIKKLCRLPHGTIVLDEPHERLMSELSQIRQEIGDGGALAKRAEQIKVMIMEYGRKGGIDDDDSVDKWIFRDRAGKKVASYFKDARGRYVFR